mmetsp:Transcript_44884/g.67563  ORF Transcript_44884/g.67563 Transcript_44884/m.67563 type:complete len:126 (+) Transcript_44884:214-591(+)
MKSDQLQKYVATLPYQRHDYERRRSEISRSVIMEWKVMSATLECVRITGQKLLREGAFYYVRQIPPHTSHFHKIYFLILPSAQHFFPVLKGTKPFHHICTIHHFCAAGAILYAPQVLLLSSVQAM